LENSMVANNRSTWPVSVREGKESSWMPIGRAPHEKY
jgi:hypothetical protein